MRDIDYEYLWKKLGGHLADVEQFKETKEWTVQQRSGFYQVIQWMVELEDHGKIVRRSLPPVDPAGDTGPKR